MMLTQRKSPAPVWDESTYFHPLHFCLRLLLLRPVNGIGDWRPQKIAGLKVHDFQMKGKYTFSGKIMKKRF